MEFAITVDDDHVLALVRAAVRDTNPGALEGAARLLAALAAQSPMPTRPALAQTSPLSRVSVFVTWAMGSVRRTAGSVAVRRYVEERAKEIMACDGRDVPLVDDDETLRRDGDEIDPGGHHEARPVKTITIAVDRMALAETLLNAEAAASAARNAAGFALNQAKEAETKAQFACLLLADLKAQIVAALKVADETCPDCGCRDYSAALRECRRCSPPLAARLAVLQEAVDALLEADASGDDTVIGVAMERLRGMGSDGGPLDTPETDPHYRGRL